MSEANGNGLATIAVLGELSLVEMEGIARELVGQAAGYTFVVSNGSIETMAQVRNYLKRRQVAELWILGQLTALTLHALRDDAEHHGINVEEKPLRLQAFA